MARRRGQLLDRLVRRAVLADADRIVREDVDDRDLHDRAQADGRPRVVAEDEEAGAVTRRTLDSAMPLTTAPIACSRMPKCMLRPPGVSRRSSRRRRRRSAASWWTGPGPPSRRSATGRFLAMRVQHLGRRRRGWPCPWRRPGSVGRSLSQPSGSSRCCIRSSWSARSGCLLLVLVEACQPGLRAARWPRLPDAVPAKCSRTPSGTRNLRVLRPAVVTAWSGGSPPRPAARRGRRRYPACWARRSRYGCRR